MPGSDSRAQQRQQRSQQNDVGQQHRVGDQAKHLVVERHEDEHRRHADFERAHTLVDIILPEGRSDGTLFNHINRCRQGTGAQQQRQIVRLV